MAQRWLEGCCFNFSEKFTPDHAMSCSMRGIYLLELVEVDPTDEFDLDNLRVSIHALTDIAMGDTIWLHAEIVGSALSALVDSRSNHCFVSMATAARLGLTPTPRPMLTVGVANGERVPSSGVCTAIPILIGQERFYVDISVIPLDGYEMVLGC